VISQLTHIVCSGCSFTRQWKRLNIDGTDEDFLQDPHDMWRWPHWIQKRYSNKKVKVWNLGNPTNDNSIIKKSIFYKVNELLKAGIDSKDIIVLVQWSNFLRNSFYIDKTKCKDYNSYLPTSTEDIENKLSKFDCEPYNIYAHISDYIDKKQYKGEFGYYLLTGAFNYEHIPYDVKKLIKSYLSDIYSEEESMIRFFDNVISLQSFLDKLNIPHLSFNIQNNFVLNAPNLSNDKSIPTTIKHENEYKNPYIQHLYELIDLDKFWFFNSKETSKGGLIEWAIKTNPKWPFHPLWMEKNTTLGHISSEMNMMFVEKELNSFFKCNLR